MITEMEGPFGIVQVEIIETHSGFSYVFYVDGREYRGDNKVDSRHAMNSALLRLNSIGFVKKPGMVSDPGKWDPTASERSKRWMDENLERCRKAFGDVLTRGHPC